MRYQLCYRKILINAHQLWGTQWFSIVILYFKTFVSLNQETVDISTVQLIWFILKKIKSFIKKFLSVLSCKSLKVVLLYLIIETPRTENNTNQSHQTQAENIILSKYSGSCTTNYHLRNWCLKLNMQWMNKFLIQTNINNALKASCQTPD